MAAISIRTKLSKKHPPLYHVHSRKGIFSFYYDMRKQLIDKQGNRIKYSKITAKEYIRRVDRINTWFSYKIDVRNSDLVAASIISNGEDDDKHKWFKI